MLHFFSAIHSKNKAMAKIIHYYYDPVSSRYKRVQTTVGHHFLRVSRTAFLTTGMAVIMVIGYSTYFELPSELVLKEEIEGLEVNYKKLDAEVASLYQVVYAMEKRDDNVYRTVLGAEPIDKAVREGGVGGADRYQDLREKKMKYGSLVVSLYAKIDKLRRKLYIESVSQNELMQLAEEKQKLYAAIPAIQPLANKQLTALASGFGLRLHPVYKVIKMHYGIDFSSRVGTPVYATADGEVIAVETAVQGYGKMVILDHGYGYQTRYAHLQGFKVKLGERVKRGVAIAYTGNTGVSTAPHLHYEVLLNGNQINPVHYFFNDLSPIEYEKIVQLASVQNQSLGN